jgi:hypothetical protein
MSLSFGWLMMVSKCRIRWGYLARVGASRVRGTAWKMAAATAISASVMRSPTKNVRVVRCLFSVASAPDVHSRKLLWS